MKTWTGYSKKMPSPYRGQRRKPEKSFFFQPHQGKERVFVAALKAAGYTAYPKEHKAARFALFHLDNGRRTAQIQQLDGHGVSVFLYPHAAHPMYYWDGPFAPSRHVRCTFVIAPGHVEVLQRYGYPMPLEVIGWPFCDLVPFEPVKEVGDKEHRLNILFGPTHPAMNGWLSKVDKDLNRRAFARLYAYCQETGAKLTIRHIHDLKLCGLEKKPGVIYIRGALDGSTVEIDKADLVVGHQTFGYLAIARGKPTLMMGVDTPPRTGMSDATFQFVKSWEKYGEYYAYPLDLLAGDGDPGACAAEMIEKARKRSAAVTAWKKKFIGEAFDGPAFVAKLESYLPESAPAPAALPAHSTTETAKFYDRLYRARPDIWHIEARNVLAFETLSAHFGDAAPESILDIGCGNGHTLEYFAKRWPGVRYAGLDLSPEAIRLARKRVPGATLVQGILGQAALPEKYAAIILLGVAEHFPDLLGSLALVREALAPGGAVYIETPNCIAYPKEEHTEGFRRLVVGNRQMEWHLFRPSWERILGEAGFEIIQSLKGPGITTEFVWLVKEKKHGIPVG